MTRFFSLIALVLSVLLAVLPALAGGHDCYGEHAHDEHESVEVEDHGPELDRESTASLHECALDDMMLVASMETPESSGSVTRPIIESEAPERRLRARIISSRHQFLIAPKTSPPSVALSLVVA